MSSKYKAVIIDDELHCIETLQTMIDKYCPQMVVSACATNAQEGIAAIASVQPDVVFTDIQMPVKSGLDMLAELPSVNFHVIFTTAYDQYAIRAIKLNALDYLLKPIDRKELIAAVSKVSVSNPPELNEQLHYAKEAVKGRFAGMLAISSASSLEFVRTADIIMMEGDSCYTAIQVSDGRKLLVSKTLQHFEELLADDTAFFRPHKSYLINLNYIRSYQRGDGGEIILTNGAAILLSKHRRQEFLNLFMK